MRDGARDGWRECWGGAEPRLDVFAAETLPVRDAGRGGDESGSGGVASFWRWKEDGACDEAVE